MVTWLLLLRSHWSFRERQSWDTAWITVFQWLQSPIAYRNYNTWCIPGMYGQLLQFKKRKLWVVVLPLPLKSIRRLLLPLMLLLPKDLEQMIGVLLGYPKDQHWHGDQTRILTFTRNSWMWLNNLRFLIKKNMFPGIREQTPMPCR